MVDGDRTLAATALTPAAEHEWTLLRELVDFADRLVVAFVFADRFPVRVLRARMKLEALDAAMPFRLVTCDSAEELRNTSLAAVLAPESTHEVTWFEAFGTEEALRDSWFFAAQRWNEHREPLRRSSLRALIVAAPTWAKPVIRLAAPDLWSITNLVIEPSALPSGYLFDAPESIEKLPEAGFSVEYEIARSSAQAALRLPTGGRRSLALMEVLADAVHAGAWKLAAQIANSLEFTPQALRSLAEEVSGIPEKRASFAARLNNLATHLAALGRPEAALPAALAAADLYRDLAASAPARFGTELAISLTNLGNRLDEVGRRNEAIAVDVEAVTACRRVVGSERNEARPVLAMCLTNLSIRLGEQGREPEALSAASEALDLYRSLVEVRPDLIQAFAKSLNNLGNLLLRVGVDEQALVYAQEAVAVSRRLAAAGRKDVLPILAATLNNLGNALGRHGRYEDALAAAEESVTITTDLTRGRPEMFESYLGLVVRSLVARLEEAKKDRDSSLALQSAQSLLESLPAHFPKTEA